MFKLPDGTHVTEEISLAEGHLQPFAHGAITSYIGRRKTPSGHRLVRGGRIVGWIAEDKDKGVMLGGSEARTQLEAIEGEGKLRLVGHQYTLSGLGSIAEIIPEAFEHQADRQGLRASNNHVERLLARDLSKVVKMLVLDPTVRGAIAIDGGMLIDYAGDLPGFGKEEALASHVYDLLSNMRMEDHPHLAVKGQGHWILHTEEWSLLLAKSGDIALAAWTERDANHARLLSAASTALAGDAVSAGADGTKLPEGFTLREGRGGPDAIVSMLKAVSYTHLTLPTILRV